MGTEKFGVARKRNATPAGAGVASPKKARERDARAKYTRFSSPHARRHHAAVTVTNEDHVPPILVFEHCSHVLDMGLEIDHRMREMGALAEAC